MYYTEPVLDNVKKEVLESFDFISSKTCIKFRPKLPADKNWIEIYKGSG